MSDPHVSFVLLGPGGELLADWDGEREYYAASTIKLAVAAALMFAVEAGELSLEQRVPSARRFASRIPGTPVFEMEAAEFDPGLPDDGVPLSLRWCLERMLTVSSNEATNLLVEALGAGRAEDLGEAGAAGIAGLDAVREACERLGVPGVRMTRLICDYAAREDGFTHAASAKDLARLMRAITCGEDGGGERTGGECTGAAGLRPSSRGLLLELLRAQRFPIIAQAVPVETPWASKSGWDDGIRHDVALIGEPGSRDCRVLAICTEGYPAAGAQKVIGVLAAAVLGDG